MSKVAIQGDASGTGTFTVAAPNSNANPVLMMPEQSGTLGYSGPSFSAQGNSQTVSNGASVRLSMSIEDFDSHGKYNNTGADVNGIPPYAFKPDVPGWYMAGLMVSGSGTTTATRVFARIMKNGAVAGLASTHPNSANASWANAAFYVYLNVGDYLEAYTLIEGTGTLTANAGVNQFYAFFVRP